MAANPIMLLECELSRQLLLGNKKRAKMIQHKIDHMSLEEFVLGCDGNYDVENLKVK